MEFIYYFADVFQPTAFALLLLGTIGGLILGATPGLSPSMTVALLIPFTFHLTASHGLILLGAAYTSTVAGGAISAILLKIPGAPANIATALDGYAMASKGEAARALQISFIASVIGGIFGILLLIFLTPSLAKWALAFGASHLFWLSLLGITIIAGLDSKDSMKGLISGCIGLWLSTIGYDDIQGVGRFTFHDSLIGGINIIAALIGLFAIPQALTLLAGGDAKATMMKIVPYPIASAFKEIFRSRRALSVGAITGAIIGLIPGVGGQIAGLIAYDQSKKFSKTPQDFGQGHGEGVIAAESANNAMVGPSLVPLLTLSIPGSPTAAVLLGGLLIHGIFPGPNLFENHGDVAWVFIDSMLIGQVLMGIFGIMLASTAARIIKVPPSALAAGIVVLALFGSYAVRQSVGDIYSMLALGMGMYFLQRFGFSAAPLALGLILGPIAEANYVQGSLIATAGDGMVAYFFGGSLNIIIIGLVGLSIAYSIFSSYKLSPSPSPSSPSPPPTDKKQFYAALIIAACLAVFAMTIGVVSWTADSAAYLFPRLIATTFVALCVFLLYRIVRTKETAELPDIKKLAAAVIGITLYGFIAAKLIGFYVASYIIFLFLLTIYDNKGYGDVPTWCRRMAVALVFMTVIYSLFTLLLRVQIPHGLGL